MTIVEDVVYVASFEDQELISSVDRIINAFSKVEDSAKETNTEFQRFQDSLGVLTKGAVGFGVALVGALTGGLLVSPQFKEFLGGLNEPFFRLSNFLGQQFQGSLKSAGGAFRDFVNDLTTDEDFKSFLGDLDQDVSKAIKFTTDLILGDDQTDGLLKQMLGLFEAGKDVVNLGVNFVADVTGLDVDEAQKAILAGLLIASGNPAGIALGVMIADQVVAGALGSEKGPVGTVTSVIGKAAKDPGGALDRSILGAFNILDLISSGGDIEGAAERSGSIGPGLVTQTRELLDILAVLGNPLLNPVDRSRQISEIRNRRSSGTITIVVNQASTVGR